ncbi:chemotaxis-specific protein-glutamate methyltransferase CheB [Maridesulfovibrio bastinii]|uniref:chemotaxis-specific protein-glutamate methyltransferase CheB n=1 Tax=Maridesulfovibrio bastinii TaxID=47157 RepID=UPI0003F4F9FD|nr:chemotaxis-specific protein-glutamate methyltransferase CheB [Maridesulfovibrio bastinii]
MIRILIVDDSISVRELLYRYFSDQEDMEVAGMAVTGAEAIEKVHKLKPDIVTMDIHLPDMDGFQVTRRIMEESPLPIVIISSVASPDDSDDGFRALDSGALTLIDKPRLCDSDFEDNMNDIIHTVRLMSEVKVVRRRIKKNLINSGPVLSGRSGIKDSTPKENIEAVCIGTSTGGPQALKAVLGALPENYPLPILVVQHMSKGFLEGMVSWLDNVIPLKVKAADAGETVRGGFVYFAPEEKHMRVNSDLTVSFSSGSASDGIIPSVSVLFASAARNLGHRAAGIIMTGMGRDGAAELLEMRKAGAYTIAQNKESCTVYGMPGEAVKLGAAIDILPLEEISGELLNFAGIKS